MSGVRDGITVVSGEGEEGFMEVYFCICTIHRYVEK